MDVHCERKRDELLLTSTLAHGALRYIAAHLGLGRADGRRRRREVYAGASTVGTVLGNKLAPWLADRYLARTGYDSQQTNEPVDPNRPDYLFEPVPGDRGARGVFGEEARDRDMQFWAVKNRRWLGFAGAVGLAGGAYALLRRS